MKSILNWIDNKLVANRNLNRGGLLKLTCSLILLLSLVSYDRYDPNPFNLLSANNEVNNWLGLPGALFSGFVRDLFGLMSYAIPAQLLLLSRLATLTKVKIAVQELLELLVLCSLIALIIPQEIPIRFDIVGSWGQISSQTLSDFPGKTFTIISLICFQPVYFKSRRFDLTLFAAIGISILLSTSIFRQFKGQTKRIILKTARYSSINIFSPLNIITAKAAEATGSSIRTISDRLREKIYGTEGFSHWHDLLNKLLHKSPSTQKPPMTPTHKNVARESEMLNQIIEVYRNSHYKADRNAFLNLEEEI